MINRLTVGCLILCISTMSALANEVKTVNATGEGISPEAAKKDALRNALEKGATLFLASYTNTENFTLTRDTIFTKAEGLVKSYKVLEAGEGAGSIYYCKIRADVSTDAVATAWGEVQNVLEQLGRPKVMVIITETVDGEIQSSSILESMIENRLVESGFDAVEKGQMRAIESKEAADAAHTGNSEKMRAIAKGHGAQVYIMGNADADKAENTNPNNVRLVMYNCNVQAKAFYTDTAKILASKSYPNVRGGARGFTTFSRQAGKQAIAKAAIPLINDIYSGVMRQWSTQISFGGEITLEIDSFPNKTVAFKLKKKVGKIPGVKSVNGPKCTGGMCVYRIRATMTAEDMMEYLIEDGWDELIEVDDFSLNRIQAKYIKK